MIARRAPVMPALPAAPPTCGLPAGYRVELDSRARWLTSDVLYGGSPARALRLSATGVAAVAEVFSGPLQSPQARILGRRLTDAGIAQPHPPPVPSPDLTVVVPARDRATELANCLARLGRSFPVVVVDDASREPSVIARVATEHGARLMRRSVNGGPAAARNTGLTAVSTELVAFVDTDCQVPAGSLQQLAGHLSDPLVAAVAPRIVPVQSDTSAQRYAAVRGSLDLGPDPAPVRPLSRVGYVPSATLVVRRAALGERPFDEALRYGEDVDLVWRLLAAGWRIRYDPAVRVHHAEPPTWPELLRRRFRYGTSAAALSQRHPDNTAALILSRWTAATVVAAASGAPVAAVAGAGMSVVSTSRALGRAGLPRAGLLAASANALLQSWLNAGSYLSQFVLPLAVSAARGRRRIPVLVLLSSPGFADWLRHRGQVSLLTALLGRLADDAAYGAGVWRGCVAARTLRPLQPLVYGRRRA